MDNLTNILASSGFMQMDAGMLLMICVGVLLLYLAISHKFEPLLLLPIGFGTVLINIPGAGFGSPPVLDAMGQLVSPGGLLFYVYEGGIATGLFPLIIFMGVGAMTDFAPLLGNPKTLLLGAAATLSVTLSLPQADNNP